MKNREACSLSNDSDRRPAVVILLIGSLFGLERQSACVPNFQAFGRVTDTHRAKHTDLLGSAWTAAGATRWGTTRTGSPARWSRRANGPLMAQVTRTMIAWGAFLLVDPTCHNPNPQVLIESSVVGLPGGSN